MKYTKQEVMQFVEEEDVKFIRLAFCDVLGRMKNVSIMPNELGRAFSQGIAFDASAIEGFGGEIHSDLFVHPDPSTLTILPWRPEHGRVVRMFCSITYPDGRPFENDSRTILVNAVNEAEKAGYTFRFGAEAEFYLFKLDENGNPTNETYDNARYMDIAPDDKGENVRREICLNLERMGIYPESSHHEEGPGQNEIDVRYSDPVTSADNTCTFKTVVKTVASRNGLFADFSPKPLEKEPGNGLHVNMSVKDSEGNDCLEPMMAGILDHIADITLFLNPAEDSYKRLGSLKAPKYISWSRQNRSQLIRVPAAEGEYIRAEVRSPDPEANPYLAFALLIYAGLDGIKKSTALPAPSDINFFTADAKTLAAYRTLPARRSEAVSYARSSDFVKEHLPDMVINTYGAVE